MGIIKALKLGFDYFRMITTGKWGENSAPSKK